jgi:hypothetical protein
MWVGAFAFELLSDVMYLHFAVAENNSFLLAHFLDIGQ